MGTRLREQTEIRPKPMVEIGGRPILWHIMKIYEAHGHTDFILALGYKGDVIRDYFLNYELRNRDVTVTLGDREMVLHDPPSEADWRVTLCETGLQSNTGTRLHKLRRYLGDETFLATYGDGVADVDLTALLAYHRSQGRLATVTAVRPSSRFGELAIEDGVVKVFREKPQVHDGWINGGFFVFESGVFEHITGDNPSLEQGLLARLAEVGELAVYQHPGFWQCMDTYRELVILEDLWSSGAAPWIVRR